MPDSSDEDGGRSDEDVQWPVPVEQQTAAAIASIEKMETECKLADEGKNVKKEVQSQESDGVDGHSVALVGFELTPEVDSHVDH
jgi:hypothetical protein